MSLEDYANCACCNPITAMAFILNKKVKNNKNISVEESAGENIVPNEEYVTLRTCCRPISL